MRRLAAIAVLLSLAGCHGGDAGSTPQSGETSRSDSTPGAKFNEILLKIKQTAAQKTTPDQAVDSFTTVRNLSTEANCYYQEELRNLPDDQLNRRAEKEITPQYMSFFTDQAERSKNAQTQQSLTRCLAQRDILADDIREVKMETPTRATATVNITNITPIPEGATPDDFDKKHRESGENYRYQLKKVGNEWKIAQIYDFDDIMTHDWQPHYKPTDGQPSVPWYVSPD